MDYDNGSFISPLQEDEVLKEKEIPPYVCCVLTEGIWTWFGGILLILVLLGISTLRFCSRSIRKPKNIKKNENLLFRSALADDSGAMSKIRQFPVDIREFPKYYSKRRKHTMIDRLEFSKALSTSTKHTYHVATEPGNLFKNVNNNVVPFDFNRVKLHHQNPDYINASYVGDVTEIHNRWIVAQGPKDQTVVDFWSMIWNENSNIIVMLTRTFELTKVMCVQYWPLHLHSKEVYGDITITVLEEVNFATYMVRILKAENGSEERLIRHYHYCDWPAYEPTNTASILQFRRHVRLDLSAHRLEFGPPILHCHEGGSRCGMFLAIDRNILMAEKKSEINVFGTVQELLASRRGILQSWDHYRFVYDVLEEHLVCGITALSFKSLRNFDVLSSDSHLALSKEYERIKTLQPRFTIGDCAAAHMKENQNKNRNVMVVPPDSQRPYLSSFQGSGADVGDYINAVCLDGFKDKKEFIVTEWPLCHTLGNFWCMVYDHDVSSIIVLDSPKSGKKYPKLWPDKDFQSYGVAFGVEVMEVKNCQYFDQFSLLVHKTEVAPHRKSQHMNVNECSRKMSLSSTAFTHAPKKSVVLYHVRQQGSSNKSNRIPTSAYTSLIHSSSVGSGPVVTVSIDGYSQVGIYPAARICVEQLSFWNEVDVFQAVKSIRLRRPQLIGSHLEYKQIYDVVHDYVVNYVVASQGEA